MACLCVFRCVRIHARVHAYKRGCAAREDFFQRHVPPFLRAPFRVKSFSQTDGIWRDWGRGGRDDFVREPLVWG